MVQPTSDPAATADRIIRVFVSSTFRDMKAERDHLVKFVFPQLRRLCEERGVGWGEVDLRWGITDEQAAEGAVLPICLEEINRCRPYFICMLGERYGWVPDAVPDELVEQQPWLEEHKERSVTHLEVLHGVLNNPEMAAHAFFYFRDPRYLDRIPQDADLRDFVCEDDASEEKLRILKQQIRDSGLPVREYAGPEGLDDLVLSDLLKAIESRFPPGSEPTPLERESAAHEAFARDRARAYIGRQAYYDQLDDHIESGAPPLVVLGESGSGKSALLANWALRHRKNHPKDLVLMHFLGASSQASDRDDMLRRLIGELAQHTGVEKETPKDAAELPATFEKLLIASSTAAESDGYRTIIVLDGLNQIEDREGARELTWLPIDSHAVRVLLSTLPGSSLDELKRRDYPTMTVEPLAADERLQVIDEYLALFTKRLSPERAERVASAPQTENPLFLRVLLDELRVFGSHERLDSMLRHYLMARSVSSLYNLVLERYEDDFEGPRPGLVRQSMSFLWAAHRGLSEAELLDLLVPGEEALPQAYWAPLRLAADEGLIERSGLLTFSHDYMRQAVQDRYVPTIEQQHAVHREMARYFAPDRSETTEGDRSVESEAWDEYLSHARQCEDWDALGELLSDIDFVAENGSYLRDELRRIWVLLEQHSKWRMVEAYGDVSQSQVDEIGDGADELFYLLDGTGHVEESLRVQRMIVDWHSREGDRKSLAYELRYLAGRLADHANHTGDKTLFSECERLLDRANEFYDETGDRVGLARTLMDRADVAEESGNYSDALSHLKEAESVFVEEGSASELIKCLKGQGFVHSLLDDAAAVSGTIDRVAEISNRLDDKVELAHSLNWLASRGLDVGRSKEALQWARQAQRLYSEVGAQRQRINSRATEADVLASQGRLDESLRIYEVIAEESRGVGQSTGEALYLWKAGGIHEQLGQLDDAIRAYGMAEQVYRRVHRHSSAIRVIDNQGFAYEKRRRYEKALEYYQRQERYCREVGNPVWLSECLGNVARMLRKIGRIESAQEVCRERVQVSGELADAGEHLDALDELAIALDRESPEALAVQRERVEKARDMGDVRHLAGALDDLAFCLYLNQLNEESLLVAQQCLQLIADHGLGDLEWSALGRQAIACERLGRTEDALELCKRRAGLAEDENNDDRLAKALSETTDCLIALGRTDEALVVGKQAVVTARKLDPTWTLIASLGSYAKVLQALGKHEEALEILKEGTQVARDAHEKDWEIGSLAAEAYALLEVKRFDKALERFQVAAALATKLGDLRSASRYHEKHGEILAKLMRYDEAVESYRQAEQTANQVRYKKWLGYALDGQMSVLTTLRRFEEALVIARRREALADEMGDVNAKEAALDSQWRRLADLNRWEEALDVYEKHEQVQVDWDDPVLHNLNLLWNRAWLLERLGNLEESLVWRKKYVAHARERGRAENLAEGVEQVVRLLRASNRTEEAKPFIEEALEAVRDLNNEEAQGRIERILRGLESADSTDAGTSVPESHEERQPTGSSASRLEGSVRQLLGDGRLQDAIDAARGAVNDDELFTGSDLGGLADIASALLEVADEAKELGQIDQALAAYATAKELTGRAARAETATDRLRNYLGISALRESLTQRSQKQLDKALEAALEAQAVFRDLRQAEPKESLYCANDADAWSNIATIHTMLGDAGASLEARRQERLARQQAVALAPTDRIRRVSLLRSHFALADAHKAEGDHDKAAQECRSAVAVSAGLAPTKQWEDSKDHWEAVSWRQLGDVQRSAGQFQSAVDSFDRVLLIFEGKSTTGDEQAPDRRELAWTLLVRGDTLNALGKSDEALETYLRSAQEHERIRLERPSDRSVQMDLAATYDRIGSERVRRGEPEEGLKLYRQAVRVNEVLVEQYPDDLEVRQNLAICHSLIADFLLGNDRTKEALEELETCIDGRKQVAEGVPEDVNALRALITAWQKLHDAYKRDGQTAKAIDVLKGAAEWLNRCSDDEPWANEWTKRQGHILLTLGLSLSNAGRLEEALSVLRKTQEINRKLSSANPESGAMKFALALSNHHVAELLLKMDRPNDAWVEVQGALSLRTELADRGGKSADELFETTSLLTDVSEALQRRGDHKEAIEAAAMAEGASRKLLLLDPDRAVWINSLSVALSRRGAAEMDTRSWDSALRDFEEGAAILKKLVAEDRAEPLWRSNLAVYHRCTAKILTGLGRHRGALQEYRASLAVREQLAKDEPDDAERQRLVALARRWLGECLSTLKRYPEADVELGLARDGYRKLCESADAGPDICGEFANASRLHARVLLELARWDAVLEAINEATTLDKQQARQDPEPTGSIDGLYRDADLAQDAGDRMQAAEDLDVALSTFKLYLEIATALVDLDDSSQKSLNYLAVSKDRLATIHRSEGRREEALKLLQEAATTFEQLALGPSPNSVVQANLVIAHRLISEIQDEMKRLDDAIASARKSMDFADAMFTEQEDLKGWLEHAAPSGIRLGRLLYKGNRREEALEVLLRVSSRTTERLKVDRHNPMAHTDVAETYRLLGDLYLDEKRVEEALASYRSAADRLIQLIARHETRARHLASLEYHISEKAHSLLDHEAPETALELLKQAARMASALQAVVLPDTKTLRVMAHAETARGEALLDFGRLEQGVEALVESCRAYEIVIRDNPDQLRWRERIADNRLLIGNALRKLDRSLEALEQYRASVKERRNRAGIEPDVAWRQDELAWSLSSLGWCHLDLEQFDEGDAAMREALSIRRDLIARSEPGESYTDEFIGLLRSYALHLDDRGKKLIEEGEKERGFEVGEQALELWREEQPLVEKAGTKEALAWCLNNQAWVLCTILDRPEGTRPLIDEALRLAREAEMSDEDIAAMQDTLDHVRAKGQ